MSTNPEDFGRVVKARREEMVKSQMEIWSMGGPSNSTLTTIENGRLLDLTPATAKKLDYALGWVEGSAIRLWRTGEAPDVAPPEVSRWGVTTQGSRIRKSTVDLNGFITLLSDRIEELEERMEMLESLAGPVALQAARRNADKPPPMTE